jgi:hypothetical protein
MADGSLHHDRRLVGARIGALVDIVVSPILDAIVDRIGRSARPASPPTGALRSLGGSAATPSGDPVEPALGSGAPQLAYFCEDASGAEQGATARKAALLRPTSDVRDPERPRRLVC